MPEYKVTLTSRGVSITDQAGAYVSEEIVAEIAYRLERSAPKMPYIYLLVEPTWNAYKIGYSTQPIEKRISQIASNHHAKPQLVHRIMCGSVMVTRDVEDDMHRYYKQYHFWKEWFYLPPEEVGFFKTCSCVQDLMRRVVSLRPK